MLYVRKTKRKGRGVFTSVNIPAGKVIETCPAIVFPSSEFEFVNQTKLFNYYFAWGRNNGAILLGLGSLYNHSDFPNAEVVKQFRAKVALIVTTRSIRRDEEILIDYRGGTKMPLWFDVQ